MENNTKKWCNLNKKLHELHTEFDNFWLDLLSQMKENEVVFGDWDLCLSERIGEGGYVEKITKSGDIVFDSGDVAYFAERFLDDKDNICSELADAISEGRYTPEEED